MTSCLSTSWEGRQDMWYSGGQRLKKTPWLRGDGGICCFCPSGHWLVVTAAQTKAALWVTVVCGEPGQLSIKSERTYQQGPDPTGLFPAPRQWEPLLSLAHRCLNDSHFDKRPNDLSRTTMCGRWFTSFSFKISVEVLEYGFCQGLCKWGLANVFSLKISC